MGKYVIGNWKLNPATKHEAIALAKALTAIDTKNLKVGCVPSFVHLDGVASTLADSPIWLGVQDVCAFGGTGAFTGDVSAVQAYDLGAKFALIGHSERRNFYKENNDLLAKKMTQAFNANLVVVLCIGETKAEYESGDTLSVLESQLAVLDGMNIDKKMLVIAYEPVWAIGTGLTPTLDEIGNAHRYIKSVLSAKNLDGVCVIYGGSVNDKNAAELATCCEIDGVLVGGASLKIDSFTTIVSAFLT